MAWPESTALASPAAAAADPVVVRVSRSSPGPHLLPHTYPAAAAGGAAGGWWCPVSVIVSAAARSAATLGETVRARYVSVVMAVAGSCLTQVGSSRMILVLRPGRR